MKELLEQETGGIHVWDELFDRAFELCDYHQLSAFNVHDGVRVKDFVDGEARGCAKSIIQAHAEVSSNFIQFGGKESRLNH